SDPVDNDLTRVSGIEPGVAAQLHDAGIHTVAELAQATVEQVVAACGNEQVANARAQGWIEQAAELVDAELVDPVPPAAVPAASGQARLLPRRTFTVEVWVDGHAAQGVATRLVHLETQEADAWSGWSRPRLLDFMEKRIGVADPERGATGGSAGPEPGLAAADAAPAPDVVHAAVPAAADHPLSPPALVVPPFGLGKAAARGMRPRATAAPRRLDADDLDLPPGLTAVAQVELLAQPLGGGRAEVIDACAIDLAAGRAVDAVLRGRLPDRQPPFAVLAVVRVLVDQPGGRPTEGLG